jgi:hypothetical protein
MVSLNDIISNKHKFEKRILGKCESECFSFKGFKDKLGYVSFQFRSNGMKKNIFAHRASYMIHNLEEIRTDDVIMHMCDNPSCINPNHLKRGTHMDNVKDRIMKGRSACGEKNGRYIHGEYMNRKKKKNNRTNSGEAQ